MTYSSPYETDGHPQCGTRCHSRPDILVGQSRTPLHDRRDITRRANARRGFERRREVGGDTRFHFEQDGERIYASYSGGDVVDGHLVGTFDGRHWEIRHAQINEAGETATGHSVGVVELLDDGRVSVEDEWEWESREGSGETVLEEVRS